MTTLEIDGKKCEAAPGAMIIEVADEVGIRIPRFCFHKKLSIAANCRMCLVQVEKLGKPVPACATPVTEGMIVHTQSKMALEAQRGVMEFLLINHPLDCPICDQGGECELQDLSMGYGADISKFHEGKRAVADKDIGPLIETEMTRCIHCTRCVRFGEEIAGMRELGATGRGEHMEIGTFLEKSVDSELSGNVIDLCPVGALTSKPYRFSTRAWQLRRYASVSPHDCLGSNLYLHVNGTEGIKRVVPRENESINEVWLSDRDRFSYQGLNTADRLTQPMIKENGTWQTCDWTTAFKKAATHLSGVIEKQGAKKLAALLSPSSTMEEAYLLQKIMRRLGSENIDHRIWQTDFRDDESRGPFPYLGMPIADIETQDTILIVGSHTRKAIPLLNHRIRKAKMAGGQVYAINPVHFDFNFDLSDVLVPNHADLLQGVAQVLKAVSEQKTIDAQAQSFIESVVVSESARKAAKALLSGEKKYILLGEYIETETRSADVRYLAQILAKETGAVWGETTMGANSAGAWLAGAVPHRQTGVKAVKKSGMNAQKMLQEKMKAFVLFGIEPDHDGILNLALQQALKEAEVVIACAAYLSPMLKEVADVILPIGLFSETAGTFVNIAGQMQSFKGAIAPPGEARPGWKVLRVLGNVLHLEGFDYADANEVLNECTASLPANYQHEVTYPPLGTMSFRGEGVAHFGLLASYALDAITRRATALQDTSDAKKAKQATLVMNETLAKTLKLQTGHEVHIKLGRQKLSLAYQIDNTVADNAVMMSLSLYGAHPLNSALELQGA